MTRKTLWLEHRRQLEGDLFATNTRVAAFVMFAINSLFVYVDWLEFPDRFFAFLPVRLTLDALLVVIMWRTAKWFPVASAFMTALGGALMLLIVIAGTGGPTSEYCPGLILLFLGAPVIVPLSAVQTGLIVGPILAAFLSYGMLRLEPGEGSAFAVRTFFVSAAGFVGLLSAAALDRVRFSDFCQRRELERARDELKQLDRAKSRFTANVHHELRTPLTLVLSPLEAMLNGDFGELGRELRHYLRTMQSNALRLLKLINNLLDIVRAETRELKLRRQTIEPGRIVADVVAGAQPMAERKGIVLDAAGFEDCATLYADPDALEKILFNLVGNALKFTDSGGRIHVFVRTDARGLALEVSDTGVGIPADQLERIFDRFAQVDASATRKYEGTGIGLSLARELVTLHGGQIWAESEGIGRGSRFCVELPRVSEEGLLDEDVLASSEARGVPLARALGALEAELDLGPQASEQATLFRTGELARTIERWSAQQDSAQDEGSERFGLHTGAEILVVEDNGEMRRLLAYLLGREFRVRQARNGKEALECVRERMPDLVLADVMMPEMSGTELCRAIKESPELRGVPIVIITSKAEQEMKVEGLELGADDYVTKPFHPRELLARVRNLVRLRRLHAELEERNQDLESTLNEVDASRREIELYARAVSHDLRSPLAAASEALRIARSARDERREEMLVLTATSLEIADRMLLGLRDLMRTVGRFEAWTRFSARDLAAEIVEEIRAAQPEHSIQIDLEGDCGSAYAQRGKMASVFRNLLTNAARHVKVAERPRIQIKLQRSGDEWSCAVQDNGEGIPPEYQKAIFEPFGRAPGTHSDGLGLGLALVDHIVQHHGGRVWVESSPGKGATFRFTVPDRPGSEQ
jgi:signal transduction histidine kinase